MTSPRPDQDGSDIRDRFRAVAEILQRALDRTPPDQLDDALPTTWFDLFVVMGRDDPFVAGQMGLDILATQLADRFGQMTLAPPTAYNADVMLHARVAAPASEGVRTALEVALIATMQEFVGRRVHPSVAVRPAGERSDETAVVQVFFPLGTDPGRFATGFSTRDYFRWQVELGTLPGVGAVQSEPCSVLGADVPVSELLPPNLMISFAIVGDVEITVRSVLGDLRRRLAYVIPPTEIVVGVSVSVEPSTPQSVRAEIAWWRARGYPLLDHDANALSRPMESTTLLFEFPIGSGTDVTSSPLAAEFGRLIDPDP